MSTNPSQPSLAVPIKSACQLFLFMAPVSPSMYSDRQSSASFRVPSREGQLDGMRVLVGIGGLVGVGVGMVAGVLVGIDRGGSLFGPVVGVFVVVGAGGTAQDD